MKSIWNRWSGSKFLENIFPTSLVFLVSAGINMEVILLLVVLNSFRIVVIVHTDVLLRAHSVATRLVQASPSFTEVACLAHNCSDIFAFFKSVRRVPEFGHRRFPYTYFNHLVAQFIYSLTASLHLIEHGTWMFQMSVATYLHIHLVLCGSTLSISAVKVDHEQQFVDNVAGSQAIYGNVLPAVFLMLQRPHRFSVVSVTVAKGVRLTITMCHRPGSFSS